MTAVTYRLDAAVSRASARTDTEGMLSPMAHRLEVDAGPLSGHASVEAHEWKVSVVMHVSAFRVVGALKNGLVARDVLSPRDRGEIERRIRDDVFAGSSELTSGLKGPGRELPADSS